MAHRQRSASVFQLLTQSSAKHGQQRVSLGDISELWRSLNGHGSAHREYKALPPPMRQLEISHYDRNSDGVYVYHVIVRAGSQSVYVIKRRFKEFRKLHQEVSALIGRRLPPLPPSGFITSLRPSDPSMLSFRKEQLQKIIRFIEEDEVARCSGPFTHFLGRDPNEPGFVSLGMYSTPPQLTATEIRHRRRNNDSSLTSRLSSGSRRDLDDFRPTLDEQRPTLDEQRPTLEMTDLEDLGEEEFHAGHSEVSVSDVVTDVLHSLSKGEDEMEGAESPSGDTLVKAYTPRLSLGKAPRGNGRKTFDGSLKPAAVEHSPLWAENQKLLPLAAASG